MLLTMQIKNKFKNKKRTFGLSQEKVDILLESNKSSNAGFITDEEQEKTKTN
jgi:hypothetical protein